MELLPETLVCFFLLLLVFPPPSSCATESPTSIVFTTYARSNYAFDIFTLPVLSPDFHVDSSLEVQATDGISVNYNGFFYRDSLLYVSERGGTPAIYLSSDPSSANGRRSAIEAVQSAFPVIPSPGNGEISLKDRPSVTGDRLIYVSTETPARALRQSWAAVYSMHLETLEARRLTPDSVADFSPAVSPSGEWTAVASCGKRGWSGEVEELPTDIYLFKTSDGSGRFKLVENGGWPSFSDDSTVYFHRKADDGWWSIFRAAFRCPHSPRIERVTPPGVHAFTPAASPGGKFIVVATRRPGSEYRHIEIFDLVREEFIEVTKNISPEKDHYSPFLSDDSLRVGYHRCRGPNPSRGSGDRLFLENIKSPIPSVSIFRIDGAFPAFSPDGKRIAYIPNLPEPSKLSVNRNDSRLRSSKGFTPDGPGVYVVNRDGSGKRMISDEFSFGAAWDYKRRNVVYTSVGRAFGSESTSVDIVSISFSDTDTDPKSSKIVTLASGGNNAFPSPSPDGRFVVFRSSRSGHKNLYVTDAVKGERGGLWRLTEGEWTDTMCVWSPDGEWIAFSSNRDEPGSEKFELYLIHPNGTGLRRLLPHRIGGKANHPWFSPDSARLVFGADYAAVSAEPISTPQQNMVHGEVFTAKLDGSELRRITHNYYEDGAAAWGPGFIEPVDVVDRDPIEKAAICDFDDLQWLEHMTGAGSDGTNVTRASRCG
ncbi:tolB protein [Nymphaea thermarum]|nr:tolB protein [Nymphaea thermarum]